MDPNSAGPWPLHYTENLSVVVLQVCNFVTGKTRGLGALSNALPVS